MLTGFGSGTSEHGDDDSLLEEAQTLIGYCHERHVCALLEECMMYQRREALLREFRLADGSDSPDAIVLGDLHLLFEAKATRMPRTTGRPKLCYLIEWLDKVAGSRAKTGRPPFEQGLRFIRSWRNRDPNANAKMGLFTGVANLRYILVVADPVPPIVNWMPFRRHVWGETRFTHEQSALNERTLIISVREVELLTSVLKYLHERDTPKTVTDVLNEWLLAWPDEETLFAFRENRGVFKLGLGDYLRITYPEASKTAPQLILAAAEEAFAAASEFGFGRA